jgi:hypothetical protein
MTYRIFTNDRGRVGGIPKYSCLLDSATSKEIAHDDPVDGELRALAAMYEADFGTGVGVAPVKVLAWPPDEAGKRWLAAFVD